MPGNFPDEPRQHRGSDGGGRSDSSSDASTPPARTMEEVEEELSQTQALLDCLPLEETDPGDIEFLEAQLLRLQNELSRLVMDHRGNLPFPGVGGTSTSTRETATVQYHPLSDHYGNSLSTPDAQNLRKRGYSQVDPSPEDVDNRRRLQSYGSATLTYPNLARAPPKVFGDLSDDWPTEYQWPTFPAAAPGPSNPQLLPSLRDQIAQDEAFARRLQAAEVIDLTGSDDEDTGVSSSLYGRSNGHIEHHLPQIEAYRSRVKIEPRKSATGFGSWSVFKEYLDPDDLNQLEPAHSHHAAYPAQPYGHQMHPPNRIITLDDDYRNPQVSVPQYLSSAQGFPQTGAFQYPHESLASSIQYETEQEQEQVSKILEHLSDDAENSPPDGRLQTPPRLDIQLLEYQKIGLTWLTKQEESNNRGGILADDMGLGKTIQTLALIVHRPSSRPHRKTTLIVCPVALMAQWQREIETKVKSDQPLSTYIYHGQQPKRYKDFHALKEFDVILTSYGTVAGEFKKKQVWRDQKKTVFPATEFPFLSNESVWYRVILDESQHIKNHRTLTSRACADLIGTYRLCLSGTPMQNSIDDLFGAVRFLRITRYREFRYWSRDFSSLIRLGKEFKVDAMQRLHALIKAIMLRRKKDSLVDGKPLLVLPPKNIEVIHPVFSGDEQELYNAVEQNVQLRFNRYLEAGSVSQNYTYVLLLLLRLRQVCCHPRMIKDLSVKVTDAEKAHQQDLMDELTPEVIARLKSQGIGNCPICFEVDNSMKIVLPCGHDLCKECLTLIVNQAQQMAMAAGNDAQAASCPQCRGPLHPERTIDWHVFESVHMDNGGGGFDGEMARQINNVLGGDSDSGSDDSDSEDGSSDDNSDDTSDEGSDLNGFIVDDDEVDSEDDDEEEEDKSTLNNGPGSTILSNREPKKEDEDEKDEKLFDLPKFDSDGENDDDDDILKFIKGDTSPSKLTSLTAKPNRAKGKEKKRTPKKPRKAKKSKKAKGKKAKKGKQREGGRGSGRSLVRQNKNARAKYFRDLAKNWTTSAKIEKVREILRTIRERDPTEKTIIFSSFTSFLNLLQIPLQNEDKIQFERYDGSMSAKDRNDAVLNFTSSRNNNVMLISLKAGNSGLNLTAASNVIIIEPWWNPYVEEQAIDRAHRIGQGRPVVVHRLIIEQTVEDRIMELQERKREVISQAMDEEARKNISRLSVRDLVYLFTGRK
ncbi:hypothetical protein DRE_07575 [Drechslerella stenobrocha 248]|uniref:Uncharacterized protein n=1 Tax=Drechslerella stenobrocha 248 TaxID=1043628 RepID=W7I430_9PEZI|nr:hypothetical protein DRE_07575 [Drechslerella stenobrocha 248]